MCKLSCKAENVADERTTDISYTRAGLLAALLLIGIWPQTALAQAAACTFTQITNTRDDGDFSPSAISGDGTRIAFVSDRDLTGSNADGNDEIFLFDTSTSAFTQITNTVTSAGSFRNNSDPSINADGTRIAFVSSHDLTGAGTAGINGEIFLFDTNTGAFTQITNTDGQPNSGPSINADGTRIAFVSFADLAPGDPGNDEDDGSGNGEIFLFDTITGAFTQITDTMDDQNMAPSINADGTRIAFQSNARLTGGGGGTDNVFLFDATTRALIRIPTTDDSDSFFPSISADGTRIAFESSTDTTGENPEGNREIFVFDTITSAFIQITKTTEGFNSDASINADGTRITFGGSLFDTGTSTFIDIPGTTAADSSINDDGTRIPFLSNRDLAPGDPGNADGNTEIFLANCANADLSLVKTDSPDPVTVGQNLTYTVIVTNNGADDATGVMLTDTLPSGATFVSASPSQGDPCTELSGAVSCSFGDIANSGSAQVEIVITPNAAGNLTNTAQVVASENDPDIANNTDTEDTTVNAVPARTCNGLRATKGGTRGSDVLIGTNGNDVIVGLRGNDIIIGRRGHDTLCGGRGSDRLLGQRGNDTLLGQRGRDTLNGGRGFDRCNGGPAADRAVRCERVVNVP